MITLGLLNEKEITLDLMTEKCYEIQEGLVVTSQAIKNRIDTCTEFLKESMKETFGLLFEALASDVVEPLKVLFADVKIVDSSIIALPDGLKEDYKGLGGRNADSAVKLQVIYSAFNRSMLACDLKHGTENDKVYLEDVYKERLRKVIKSDPTISAEKKCLLHWNLMITNVTQSQCTLEQIALFYRLRWQIELLFKTLKSTLSLDKMHIGKKDYIDALLYGRLIGTLLTNAFYTVLNRTLFKTKGLEVSSQKFYKLIKGKLYKLYTFQGDSNVKINSISEELLRIAEKAAFQKRERKITIQQLRLELLSGDW